MGFVGSVHHRAIYGRRVQVLAHHLARMVPERASVLDVGCGDGAVARALMDERPDLGIEGLDVLVRPKTVIPVRQYDGSAIPLPDASIDVVMFVDVLHHTADPASLLREAVRVSRKCVVIKDHCADGLLAVPTLKAMDWVGSRHHGVALPYNYWSMSTWMTSFADLHVRSVEIQQGLGLCAWPLDLLFGRSLHLMVRLEPVA